TRFAGWRAGFRRPAPHPLGGRRGVDGRAATIRVASRETRDREARGREGEDPDDPSTTAIALHRRLTCSETCGRHHGPRDDVAYPPRRSRSSRSRTTARVRAASGRTIRTVLGPPGDAGVAGICHWHPGSSGATLVGEGGGGEESVGIRLPCSIQDPP